MIKLSTQTIYKKLVFAIMIMVALSSLSLVFSGPFYPVAYAADPPEVGPIDPDYNPDGPNGPYEPGNPLTDRPQTGAKNYESEDGRTGGYELQGFDKIFGIPEEGTLTEMLVPFFLRIISFLFALVGLLAILGIVYSSYILATSGGNEQNIQTGKKGITNAIIGLIIALSGYVIIYTIQDLLGI